MIFKEDGYLEICPICVIAVLKFYVLQDSFTAHLQLPLFLARHILLTGLSQVSACTSPLIRTLRTDSADLQHQCNDETLVAHTVSLGKGSCSNGEQHYQRTASETQTHNWGSQTKTHKKIRNILKAAKTKFRYQPDRHFPFST